MKEDRQHVFFTHSLWIYTSRFAKYEVTEIFPSFSELKKIWCIRNVQDLGHYNNDDNDDDDNYKIMIQKKMKTRQMKNPTSFVYHLVACDD